MSSTGLLLERVYALLAQLISDSVGSLSWELTRILGDSCTINIFVHIDTYITGV